MTFSIIIFDKFKNDERLADFMGELAAKAPNHHSYSDNVIFAQHDGSSRQLYDDLKKTILGRPTDLIVIEAANVQDTSWSAQGNTFAWLEQAFPNWDTKKTV